MDVKRPALAIVGIACAALVSFLMVSAARADGTFIVTKYGDFSIDFTDIRTPGGGLVMGIQRVYNSFGSATKGRYGNGWETQSESYLRVQDDGSIVIREYGGGANNKFEPMTSRVRPQKEIVDDIMRAAEQTGKFGSEADRQAYRLWLEDSADRQEEAWEYYTTLGLLKPQVPAVGATFFSGRFATEFVTRVPEGYQRETHNNGRVFFEAFDLSGRLTRYWDLNRDYIALSYAPGPTGQLRWALDNEGDRFVFSLTANGLVSRVTDSHGDVLRYQYKNADLQSVDVNGSVTRYDYDSDDKLIAIRHPNHTSMQIAYNQNGLVSLVKDTDDTVNTYSYASRKTQTSRVDTFNKSIRKPSGESHQISYQFFYAAPDYNLERRIETDDGIVATDTTYDSNLDPLTITTAKGTTSTTYDQLDRPVREQTPTGTVIKWEYDPATGKVSIVTRTDKDAVLTERYEYDPKGNLARAYDSTGHDISISYDSFGRIAAVTGTPLQLGFEYTDSRASDPATVVLAGVGTVRITYLASGSIGSEQSSGGPVVLDKVRAALKMVDDLIQAASVDVITLPAQSK
jgi:YD repeat-containing protein